MTRPDGAKVYNVKHVNFTIGDIWFSDTQAPDILVEGISPDGFGITPTAETAIVPGLKGEQGFSVDPSDGAEISLTLKSTSPTTPELIDLYEKQQLGSLAPFSVTIDVTNEETSGTRAQDAFGFKSMYVEQVMFVNYAPFETDEREAPDYEFEFVGFGLTITKPDEEQVTP